MLVVLVTAIINYFIGTFIPVKSKEPEGFFGYDGMTTRWLNPLLYHLITLRDVSFSSVGAEGSVSCLFGV